MLDKEIAVTDGYLHRAVLALLVCLVAAPAALLSPGLARAQPSAVAPQMIDGPNANIRSLGGMAIARDGSGGIVYVEDVGGVSHTLVAELVGGHFQAPQVVDAGLAGASSTPVIAAAPGGQLLVAFVNGGELYVTQATGRSGGWSTPLGLAPGASSPSIAVDSAGLAYVAYTANVGNGDYVLVDYDNGSSWSAATGPMNVTPGDQAGTGTGAPEVATAGDGVGIVTWGEGGHVYARRVWADDPSVVDEQLDPPAWAGWSEVSAGSPAISVGGDSSYVDVAFAETVTSGGQSQARVLVSRLVAEQVGTTVAVDGLGTPGIDAAQPEVVMNEYGRGFTTATTDQDNITADQLGTNGSPGATQEVNVDVNTAQPYATPGIAGLVSTFIAWQQTPAGGVPGIELRFAQNGTALGLTTVVSSPAAGPTDAVDGLVTGGDNVGDAALAWVQGAPGALSIDTVQLYQPPHQPRATASLAYARSVQPVLAWSPSAADWGPVTYSITFNGLPIGQTTGTSFVVPSAQPDGPHAWTVTATNPAGLTSQSPSATAFIDTTAPRLRLTLRGKAQISDTLTARLIYSDPAHPGQPGARASGVAAVSLSWGDGSRTLSGSRIASQAHVYTHARTFLIKARIIDRAGNVTQLTRRIRVAHKPVPKRRRKRHHAPAHT